MKKNSLISKKNKILREVKIIENSDEYVKNKIQIDCIKDVLINHADVPEELLNLLIESVEKNVALVSSVYKENL